MIDGWFFVGVWGEKTTSCCPTSVQPSKTSATLLWLIWKVGLFRDSMWARWMDTDTRKQCSENMKRCMETILDVRNGFEIHHAVKIVKVVIWSHHVLIFWSYPSFSLWISHNLGNCSPTISEKLHSHGWCGGWPLPGQRFEWHPVLLGIFLPLTVAGDWTPAAFFWSRSTRFFTQINRRKLNRDKVNFGALNSHADAVSTRKENRSSPKTPAKSWFLENSLGPLAKVIPQSKNGSVFLRNEGEQSLEITTGQVGKVTDRRAVSSKTLLSFRMFLDSRYVCIVLWPVYETDSSIKLHIFQGTFTKLISDVWRFQTCKTGGSPPFDTSFFTLWPSQKEILGFSYL